MPHLIIEVSKASLMPDPNALLLALNNNLMLSQEFEAQDIKSRLYIADNSLVGVTANTHDFISMTLKIMPGRSSSMKTQLIDGLILTTQKFLKPSNTKIEITVEVLELNSPDYRKFIIE